MFFLLELFYVSVFCCNFTLATLLVDAILQGNVDLVVELANQVTVNEMDEINVLPLTWAIRKGNTDVVKILLAAGAAVNQYEYRHCPLATACVEDRADMVKLLRENGANMDVIYEGNDFLNYACKVSSWRVARYLVEVEKFDVNRAGKNGATPLMYACRCAPFLAKFMIEERNGDVNAEDDLGQTPLFDAAWDGTGELATLMIRRNADVNKQSVMGNTPLKAATFRMNTKMMRILLDNGADPNARIVFGDTALHVACYSFNFFKAKTQNYQVLLEPVRMLLEGGANPYIKDRYDVALIDELLFLYKIISSTGAFYYLKLLEVFLEARVKMNNLGKVMSKIGSPLMFPENFEEYFRRLVTNAGDEFPDDFLAAVIKFESEGYDSLWYVSKRYFELERNVEIASKTPYYERVIKDKLFDTYYEERPEIFRNTYFHKMPFDFIRWFWIEILNRDMGNDVKQRAKSVEAFFAFQNAVGTEMTLEFSISNEDVKPLIKDLLLECYPKGPEDNGDNLRRTIAHPECKPRDMILRESMTTPIDYDPFNWG